MRRVFVDTFYWVAVTDRSDNWHSRAIDAGRRLASVPLVTTESVLIEFVNFFSSYGAMFRWEAVGVVHDVLGNANVEVVPQTLEAIITGMALFAGRADKQYSLTDCLSMQVMREMGIFEVLTHDQHFTQEGFVVLMRD